MAVAARIPEIETPLPAREHPPVGVPRLRHKSLINLTENVVMVCTLVVLGIGLVYLHACILRVGYFVNQLERDVVKTQNDINHLRARIGRLTAAVTVEQLARAQGRKRVEPHEIDDLRRLLPTGQRPAAQTPSGKTSVNVGWRRPEPERRR